MSWRDWWNRLRGVVDEEELDESGPPGPTPLPTEPFVFECRQCGKVFEARRKHPLCPECDSDDVAEAT
jgi:hypothetical protein